MKNKITLTAVTLLISTTLFGSAGKSIEIDLTTQMAFAKKNNVIQFQGRISSGKKGMETPNGDYQITQKKEKHKSNLWPKPNGGASMPYMMRLSGSAYALHLGRVASRPVSHGCVRLGSGFAQKMYKWAPNGTPVHIHGDSSKFNGVVAKNTKIRIEGRLKKKKSPKKRRPQNYSESFEFYEYGDSESTGLIEVY